MIDAGPWDDLEPAFHEAGHAVMALTLGQSLTPGPDGGVQIRGVGMGKHNHAVVKSWTNNPDIQIPIDLAGGAAQFKMFPTPDFPNGLITRARLNAVYGHWKKQGPDHKPGGDYDAVIARLSSSGRPRSTVLRDFRRWEKHIREVVALPIFWPRVLAIADELVEHGHLSDEQCRTLLRPLWRDQHLETVLDTYIKYGLVDGMVRPQYKADLFASGPMYTL